MKDDLMQITGVILEKIINKAEESKVNFLKLDEYNVRRKVEQLFKLVMREGKDFSLSRERQEEVFAEVVSYFFGLGPLDRFLKDPEISEIMVNGPKQIYVEKKGTLELSNITFKDSDHLSFVIEKVLSPLGRRATTYEPYVDARLNDGSRVNIVIHPVSSIGPILTIRKFSYRVLTIDDLIRLKSISKMAADFLQACVVSRINLLVCGGTASGKTTLLNALASFVPETERIITIEDTLELRLQGKHVVPLETRQPNIEGKGEISIRDLVKNALHMRPDRIVVGEVRSDEVLDMIQAMNTGHDGSMTTLHANSSLEALDRLEVLVLMGNPNISSEVAKRQIISALDLIVHMARLPNGKREVLQISEVIKGKEYKLKDIFLFDEKRNHAGGLGFTGTIPSFYHYLKDKAGYSCKEFEGSK